MPYYIFDHDIKYRGAFSIGQTVSDDPARIKILASSLEINAVFPMQHNLRGINFRKIKKKDFPLYISSLKYITKEFEDILKGS